VDLHECACGRRDDGIAQIYATALTTGHAEGVAGAIIGPIGADSCSYNHFGPTGVLAWSVEPADAGAFPGGDELFRLHIGGHPLLTPREEEIHQFAAEGYVSKQIARHLGVECCTVSNHLQNIYRRLDVTSRSAAIAYYKSGSRPHRVRRSGNGSGPR
jgi:DNA-binding CsgD family transcriptional regulator